MTQTVDRQRTRGSVEPVAFASRSEDREENVTVCYKLELS